MSKRFSHVIWGALIATTYLKSAHATDQLEIVASIQAQSGPSVVSIERQHSLHKVELSQLPGQREYSTAVPRPTPTELAKVKLVAVPYLLVASWADGKEPVYLELSSLTPRKIAIRITHEPVNDTRPALDAIEALGNDYESTLQRYFRARAFHRKWRYEHRLPEHQVAIRSARIWFDAAATLVKYAQSYFRMDDEVRGIMTDYETRAKSDPQFGKRFRLYANAGYVASTLAQVEVARYGFVGAIPTLVADGKLGEAAALNTRAINVLENETPEVKRSVERFQGVNLRLLRANEAYLNTRLSNEN